MLAILEGNNEIRILMSHAMASGNYIFLSPPARIVRVSQGNEYSGRLNIYMYRALRLREQRRLGVQRHQEKPFMFQQFRDAHVQAWKLPCEG